MISNLLRQSRQSGFEAKKENMALLFVLMAIEHGADVVEFLKDGDDCRVAERVDGEFHEFPPFPKFMFEFFLQFYRGRFLVQGSENFVLTSVLGVEVRLHFQIHTEILFAIRIGSNELKGKCMGLIETLSNQM